MNIYEFLTFPDISNNINAVLFYPLKSHATLHSETWGCLQPSAILECKDTKNFELLQDFGQKIYELTHLPTYDI